MRHFPLVLKNLLRYVLLLGIALGLSGQGVAAVACPCLIKAMTQASAVKPIADMPGCTMSEADMKIAKADMNKADKGSTPCKGMGLCCLSMAGGGAIAAHDSEPNLDRLSVRAAAVLPRPAEAFPLGRNILPELDPPSNLG